MRPKKTKSLENSLENQEVVVEMDTNQGEVTVLLKTEEASKPTPLTTLQKVKLMGDLANALSDTDVLSAIKSLPSGMEIMDLFTAAIEKRLNEIMENKREAEQEATALMPVIRSLKADQEKLGQYLQMFFNSELIGVLSLLAKNMGAKLQAGQAQQPEVQFQQQPVAQQQRNTPTPMPPNQIAGLGSI